MSSTIKFFIAAAAAILVLVGAIIFMTIDGKNENNSSSESDASSSQSAEEQKLVYLNQFETSWIKSVTIKNSQEEFSFSQHTRTKLDSEGNETEEIYYFIDDYADISQEEGYLYTIPNNLACAQASIVDENPQNLADYGLDESTAVTVTLKTDSDEMVLLVGNNTPVSGSSYVKLADSDTVYSVENTTVLNCRKPMFYFISKTVLEEPDQSEFPKINKVTVMREDLDYDMVFEYDITSDYDELMHGNTASHIMTSPIYSYLDVTVSSDYTHGVFGLVANDIYKIYPSDDDLYQCGFDTPYCVVLTEIEDGGIALYFGDAVEIDGETYRYGYLGGIDVIYLFNEENAPWLTLEPQTVAAPMVLGVYVFDIGKLTVESDSGNLVFEGSGDSTDYAVTLNGEEYSTDLFKTFYQFLLKTPGETVYMGDIDESNDLLCSVTVELQNDYDGVISDETIEFYSTDGRNAIIVHDGVPSFTCSISYVNALLSNIETVLAGGEAVLTY